METNRYILRKTRRFTLAAALLAAMTALYILIILVVALSCSEDRNTARIAAHELQNEVEEILSKRQESPQKIPEPDVNPSESISSGANQANPSEKVLCLTSDLPYAVFDLQGNNLFSTIPAYSNNLNVRMLSSLKEYTAPLIVDGTQVGTLVVDLPADLQWKTALELGFPALVLWAVLLILSARYFKFIKADIIRPLDELHHVVERMVKGDLSVSLSYDYDSEIGAFCHDFEAMRDELRDANQRERLYQEKERLLFASLSHDLKTPLASISGYAESIRYGVVKKPADIGHYTDIILKKTKDLTRAIEDILTHVQTQMRQMSLKKEEVYTRPLLEKLFADAGADATAQGLTLEVQGEIPNILLTADPIRLAQVIQNIVGNALKYTEPGGNITVSISVSDFLHISIEDTGCGIRPEDMPFIFEPFFRGGKFRDPNISGSGLGLSIAKSIIEQHGGKITCESTLYAGTKIVFSLAL